MEVVNTDVFEPTEHLIGQQNQTLSFGVSSDPALMAMLSTGLYTYPHRTMIQELLFNAWDAHKMNGATETPIDVYINSTSGLIVRDYGPGIEPGEGDTNIHGTYCIYGYSSKRKDKNMTGGFGLGTKAPFAYTESFSVTSFWGGTKNMYLVRRVAEDQDGRPGFTPLLKVPSTENGLMVVIPLKTGDEEKTRMVVRDISYLSGLKINIHFEEESVEEIRAEAIAPGEFYFTDVDTLGKNRVYNITKSKVYAVYGGVRYSIPRDDYYDSDLNLIYNLLKDDQQMFIGFAPNSLTPTPNRENLNLNEKTKEAIKQVFELFIERFQEIVEPLAKVYIQIAMTRIQDQTKDPLYGLYRALLIGSDQERLDLDVLLAGSKQFAPANAIDQSIWLLGLRLINRHTDTYLNQLKKVNWYLEISKAYAMLYPEGIPYLTKLRCGSKTWQKLTSRVSVKHLFSRGEVSAAFRDIFNHGTITKLQKAVHDWNQAGNYPMVVRNKTREGWKAVRFERPFHKSDDHWNVNSHKNKRGGRLHRPGNGEEWFYQIARNDKNQYKKVEDIFYAPNTIILAKTVKVLDDIYFQKIFDSIRNSPNIIDANRDDNYNYGHKLIRTQSFMAIAVRSLHGDYDRAKEFFEARGYTVWEAPEPDVSPRKAAEPKPKKLEGFRILPINSRAWVVPPGHISKVEELIQDPEYYLYRTSFDMGQYSTKTHPPYDLLQSWMKANPKTVVVNNITQANKLKTAGVKDMEESFPALFGTWFKDSKRFRILVLLEYLETAFRLPLAMLDSPAMRKEFKIPIPANVKIASFQDDIRRMQMLKSTEYPPLASLSRWVKINSEFMAPDKDFIREKNNQFTIFELQRLGAKFQEIPAGEQEAFIKKVIKMSKSF
jgi:hypothetical protein